MTRRVVVVAMNWSRDKDPRVPLGHASIVATLAAEPDIDVRSVVAPVNGRGGRPDVLADLIQAEAGALRAADIDVAFGAYVWNESLLRGTLAELRRRGFGGRIILGGPQVSYAGPGLEALYPEADAFVRGYGEEALRAIVRSPDRQRIAGVHWAGSRDTTSRADVDLECLSSPWLTGLIPLTGQKFVRWETQRGCPFRCSFCQHKEAGARLRSRELALSRIEAEIDLFCDHGVDDIAVLDPIFNMAPHATAVLERFGARGFAGRLSLQCRAEAITPPFLDAAARLNVRLELGLQTIHLTESRAIHRNNNLPGVDRALSEVRRHDLPHEVSLIFGLPEQTLASFEASVSWCLERRVPVIKAFPLLLLRGTAVDRDRSRWGLRDSGGDMPMVVSSKTFDYAAWRAMAQLSEALKVTEGRHPASLGDLKRLAEGLEPSISRFQPDPEKEVA